jgi:hypothetical protein
VPATVGDEPDQDPDHPTNQDPITPTRALALPADLLDALRTPDPHRLRSRACLYLHLHEATLSKTTPGVARVEDLGPHVLAQVQELLAHAHVTVKPVIDVHHALSVNSYEHPEAIKERIHLFRPVDAFPHASRTSRNVDLDHPVP